MSDNERGNTMKEASTVIVNQTGLHARPASLLVAKAKGYKSNITLKNGEKAGNAKSILNILALGLNKGTKVIICAEGEDEDKAVDEIKYFIEELKE